MQDLTAHYAALLGLNTPWEVESVDLAVEQEQVVIRVNHPRGCAFACPSCGVDRPLRDHRPERTWRHLDTMQFRTVLKARTPRTDCPDCGVLAVALPWAEPHGRFTLLFEAFAVKVLQACSSVERARVLLNLSWGSVQQIMDRAVERGLLQRDLDEVTAVGIDEKSFRRGQSYISSMVDLDGHRVLEVVEGRTHRDADGLFETFSQEQRGHIEAVAMDMWPAYVRSVESNAPEAEIVFDRFHIKKALNDAVDQTRRAEHRRLRKAGDETLTRSKYLWLKNPENLSDEQADAFAALRKGELKTARAYAIKQLFEEFYECEDAEEAIGFFKRWNGWASRCRIPAVVKVAKRIKRHLARMLTWFTHRISNSMAEGFNSRIQSLKSAARGFRSFENYRTRILFFCGRLELVPATH